MLPEKSIHNAMILQDKKYHYKSGVEDIWVLGCKKGQLWDNGD